MISWRTESIWSEFDRLRREMDALMNAVTRPSILREPFWREARLFPLLNVYQTDDSYVVTAEMPGLSTEDLDIKVEGDTLSLKGVRRPVEVPEGSSYHRRERTTGTFQRSITLPARVDAEQVSATYKDGVLKITLPKEKAAIPKQISVKTE